MSARSNLNAFLLDTFTESGLRAFIIRLPEHEGILAELPPDTLESVVTSASAAFERHGVVDARFFELLRKERPSHREQISELEREHWIEFRRGEGPPCTHDDSDMSGFADWIKHNVRPDGILQAVLLIDDDVRACRNIAWAIYGLPFLPTYWWHVRCVRDAAQACQILVNVKSGKHKVSGRRIVPSCLRILLDRRLPVDHRPRAEGGSLEAPADRAPRKGSSPAIPVDALEALADAKSPAHREFKKLYDALCDLEDPDPGRSLIFRTSAFRPTAEKSTTTTTHARAIGSTWHGKDYNDLPRFLQVGDNDRLLQPY